MNETAVNAQFAALIKQRDGALNELVNAAGGLALANARIAELTAQLEAATALISERATEVDAPAEQQRQSLPDKVEFGAVEILQRRVLPDDAYADASADAPTEVAK